MSTMKQLAEEYTNRIISAPQGHKIRQADAIIQHINDLVYEGSQQPISQEDKEKIAELIAEIIGDQGLAYKSADNQSYLQLVNYILAKLKASKK